MAEFPAPTKRARTSPRQEGNPQCAKEAIPVNVSLQPFNHLTHARFPPEILGLPHVLKQIDMLLLSPQEAMVEAAGSGQIEWLDELVDDYDCIALDAVEAAAANGHLAIVQVLYDVDYGHEDELPSEKVEALKKALLAAAKKGYEDIVEYLLPLLVLDPNPPARNLEKNCSLVREVFTASAATGHLEVLKLMMRMETIKCPMEMYYGGALSPAIAGQHEHVVDFLLEKHGFNWNLMNAFEEAMAQGNTALAERIFNVFPQFKTNGNLFVELAQYGHKNAVEYLYNNGQRDPDLVCNAFVKAIRFIDVVKFLHGTGLISSDAFGKAWERAARWLNADTMVHLYGLKRASPLMIKKWFERVRDVDVLKLFLETEGIPGSSIVATFSRAARCASRSTKCVEVVKFLYQNKAITSDAIDSAFVSAIHKYQTDVVKLLQNDSRLTPKGVDEGFVKAVENGQEVLVNALYEQHQISPNGLLKAFKQAVYENDVGLVKMMVRYLSADNIPPEYKLKALMSAAKRGHTRALEIVVDSESGDWPIIDLKGALSVACNSKVEHFIRKMICDQLISGRAQQVRVSGADGHLVTTLKWYKDE